MSPLKKFRLSKDGAANVNDAKSQNSRELKVQTSKTLLPPFPKFN